MKLNVYVTIALLPLSFALNAQSFVTPLDGTSLGMSKSNRVTTKDGKVHEGKIVFSTYAGGQISGFTLKTETEKLKFKAEEIALLESEPGKLQKFSMATEGRTVYSALAKDYSYIQELKYVTFEPVEIKEKVKLMQLLNPGFDEYIKVYLDPTAKENQWTGQANSYFVKKGDEAIYLKKGKYDDMFWELFSGCEKFKENFEGELKFYDFPSHIALYNESCPKE